MAPISNQKRFLEMNEAPQEIHNKLLLWIKQMLVGFSLHVSFLILIASKGICLQEH